MAFVATCITGYKIIAFIILGIIIIGAWIGPILLSFGLESPLPLVLYIIVPPIASFAEWLMRLL